MATTNIELDIENITGIGSGNADAQYIKTAQKFVVSSIPKELMLWAGTTTAVASHGGDSSPTAITLPQPTDNVLDVQRNGFSAKQVPESMQGFIANSSSLHFATETYPRYYMQAGNKVIVKPDPSDSETALVNYVDFLKVDDDCDLRGVVIFHASAQEFEKLASGKVSDWSDLTLPVAPATPDFGDDLSILSVSPVTPSLTSVTFASVDSSVDASSPLFITASVAAGSIFTGSAPSYTKPTLVLSVLSTISDLSITSILPVVPSLSSSSVSFSASAPSYTAPSSPDQTAFNDYWTLSDFGDSDPGALTITANPPVPPVINAESSSTGGAEVDTAKLATAPTYTAPVMAAPDFSDANTWVNTEEDPEMVSSRMQVIGGQISEFSSKVQDSLNTFNKENAEYQAKLQIALQDASQANSGDSTLIGKFSSELGIYQANVAKEVQEYQQKIARYQLELGVVQQSWAKTESDKLQKYQSNIQNELNNFNKSNIEYQAQLQISIQNAQLDSKDDAEKLSNYSAELQSYQNDVNKQVQEFTNNFQKNTQVFQAENSAKLSQYQSDMQNELNEFNKENIAFQAQVQESMQEIQVTNQVNIAKAQADLQISIANADRSQQRQLQNFVQDMQAIVSDNEKEMSKFQGEISRYKSDVVKEVQEYTQILDKESKEYQSKLSLYGTDMQKYQSEIGEKTQKITFSTQNAAYYSNESKKYYEWAITEVNMYVQNNSKMINKTIAAQAVQQQRR